jgi:hypothetical protein
MSLVDQGPRVLTVKAITIRQPWVWAILHAGKRIENRAWDTGHRGPLLIHAAVFGRSNAEQHEVREHFDTMMEMWHEVGSPPLPDKITMRMLLEQRGGIVGQCWLSDVILPGGYDVGRVYPGTGAARRRHQLRDDPWYTGGYGFVLKDVDPLPFVPCKGRLGLWDVPEDVLGRVRQKAQQEHGYEPLPVGL